ncbi:MAG: hypothetical protein EOO33_04980 [Comamonadaceae bacterium]|nr:MAG: hypothetical protein EOO33_04980 [Comamonadaceae bacterium]
MRRGLFFFLIVLTLLRGLVGPAMATGMALPHAAATAAPQESLHPAEHREHRAHPVHSNHGDHSQHEQHAMTAEHPSSPHPSHADHGAHCQGAQATPTAGTADHASACGEAGTAHTTHTACADCDICHTAVMAPVALRSAFDARVGAGPDLRTARFASALPAQATKPPIS